MAYDPYLTVAEITAILGVTRQRVHQIIKDHSLVHIKKGPIILVEKKSFQEYKQKRLNRGIG